MSPDKSNEKWGEELPTPHPPASQRRAVEKPTAHGTTREEARAAPARRETGGISNEKGQREESKGLIFPIKSGTGYQPPIKNLKKKLELGIASRVRRDATRASDEDLRLLSTNTTHAV